MLSYNCRRIGLSFIVRLTCVIVPASCLMDSQFGYFLSLECKFVHSVAAEGNAVINLSSTRGNESSSEELRYTAMKAPVEKECAASISGDSHRTLTLNV
ncbi:hypothetical protein BJ170DRAFT_618836 [Xylariales sp. AK1849]|nr:hypothetical protein BJ170DRAFT_618836 [Xylariales sp. AK1849]